MTTTQTFYGTDVNLETSLLEYGLLVSNEKHEDNSGTQFCVYKISENSFGTGHISENEINELLTGKDWINSDDLYSFYSFVGLHQKEYMDCNLATKISDLVSYFGTENIFGTEYNPMTEAEVIERYL